MITSHTPIRKKRKMTAGIAAAAGLSMPFDDGSVADRTGTNTVTTSRGTAGFVDGAVGRAARLRSSTLCLGTSHALQPSSFTYSFWYRPEEAMTGEQILMWAKAQYNREGWYLASNPNLPLTLSIGVGTGGPGSGQPLEFNLAQTDRSKVFPTGKWTHVMVVWDGAAKQARIFLNGVGQELVAGNTSAAGTVTATDARSISARTARTAVIP